MSGPKAGAAECSALYVCDLASGISDDDVRQLFRHYGEIVSIEQVEDCNEPAAFVDYANISSAQEAHAMLNFALVRQKTCRCLPTSSVGVIRNTMDSGQRLVVESLDPAIESRGLFDVCSAFGQVLDCKVELDEEDRSRGYGFAHFAVEDEAAKARAFLDGAKIGASEIEVRAYEPKDAVLFTGCSYGGSTRIGESDTPDAPKETGESGDAAAGRDRQYAEAFKDLQTHHLEVLDEMQGKLARLKDLTDIYTPNQEQQMIVIANSSNLPAITKLMGEVFEEGDFETVAFAASPEARQAAIEGFETGNVFAMVLASDIASRQEFELKKKAAILVNFDFPSNLQAYYQRVYTKGNRSTRVHGFFSPSIDKQLAVPLMADLEDGGHEIPPCLVEML